MLDLESQGRCQQSCDLFEMMGVDYFLKAASNLCPVPLSRQMEAASIGSDGLVQNSDDDKRARA